MYLRKCVFDREYPFETLQDLRELRYLEEIDIHSTVLRDISSISSFPKLRVLRVTSKKIKLDKSFKIECSRRNIHLCVNGEDDY